MKGAFVFLAILVCCAAPAMAAPAGDSGLTYAVARAKVIAKGYSPMPWRTGKLEYCKGRGESRECIFAFERSADPGYKVISAYGAGVLGGRRAEVTADSSYRIIEVSQPPSGLGSYAQVKARLIAQGYRPLKFRVEDSVDCQGICGAYPELLYCNGTGMNYCKFIFFRPSDRRYQEVETAGEAIMPGRLVDSINAPSPRVMRLIRERRR
jgi:hypothetical protein